MLLSVSKFLVDIFISLYHEIDYRDLVAAVGEQTALTSPHSEAPHTHAAALTNLQAVRALGDVALEVIVCEEEAWVSVDVVAYQ